MQAVSDLFLHLIRPDHIMPLRDRKLAHPRQPVHLTGILISVNGGCLGHSVGQVTIGFLRIFIAIILERAGHRTKRKDLFIRLLISQYKHALFIMIPMSRYLIQIALCHHRSSGAYIPPFLIFQILDPSLQLHDHFCTVRKKQRQPLSHHIYGRKQLHLTPQPVMVTFLNILQMHQISFQFFLLIKCGTVNPLKLCFFRVPSPVCHRRRDQLISFNGFCIHQMRSCAQIHKLSLIIEGNFRILRQILDQFHLIRFIPLLHKPDRFRPRQREAF